MKGARVRVSESFRLPSGWDRMGTVVAESDECVGVKLDGGEVPVLVRKMYVRVVLT